MKQADSLPAAARWTVNASLICGAAALIIAAVSVHAFVISTVLGTAGVICAVYARKQGAGGRRWLTGLILSILVLVFAFEALIMWMI